MLFTEFRFLIFFAITFGVYWALRTNRSRKWWLLGASYVFYGAWNWKFLFLILFLTIVDFVSGVMMARREDPRDRRPWLMISLIGNLGALCFFKYFNFFIESAADFSAWLGFPTDLRVLNIILPVGISFHTFQGLSYTIDIARKQLEPTRDLLDFSLFVAFFPQMVAGPIVRASHFLPQLDTIKRWAHVVVRPALTLFLIGYFKKVCVSDHVAVVVDTVYGNPDAYGTLDLWLGATLYAIQIYCDFSGYTDMAIATAALLGYEMPVNFLAPYLARNMQDFWRRWHISLSSWFRDYLFIPLGGSRGSTARTAFNLLVVFFSFGLWHGASWNFVIAGLFHGGFLVLERYVDVTKLPRILGHAYVYVVLLTGWAFFRGQDLAVATSYLAGMYGLPRAAPATGMASVADAWWLLPAFFMFFQWLRVRLKLDEKSSLKVPELVYGPAFGFVAALLLLWSATEYAPFIYFQF